MPKNAWTPGAKKKKSGRRVPNVTREQGVTELAKILAAYHWDGDASLEHYSEAWNVAKSTLINWLCEANRRLRSAFSDDELREFCVNRLAKYADFAEIAGDYRTAITAVDKIATVSGLVRRNETINVNLQLNPVQQIEKALTQLDLTQEEMKYIAETGQLPQRVALLTQGEEVKR
jgi:hypothetical protein